MVKVKIYDSKNEQDFVELAARLYQQCGFQDEKMNTDALIGSSYFGIAYLDDKPVGVGRVISDKVHHSLIVDLNIRKEFRGKGCGKALVIALARNAKTRNIILGTDPMNPTLPEFYRKAGFEKLGDSHLFRWPSS